ncbi:MAG: penicillin-binding protein activator LpoB [Candidatus Eisenbacteria bacterium]
MRDMRGTAGTLALALLLGAALLAGACGRSTKVTRVDPETTIDLSGRWNDRDSREVAEAMITDALNRPWLTQHMQRRLGALPIIIAGAVRNLGTEHIPTGTFVGDIERALVNSGRAQVVASAGERADLRLERADQWANASEETVKRLGEELGADYLLSGTINTITDESGGEKVVFYQVDLGLLNIESNEKVWLGQHKIKKYIGRDQYKP